MNNRKRTAKRVDVRRVFEEEQTARRFRFYQTGAPVSLGLLLLYTLASALVLTMQQWSFAWEQMRSGVVMGCLLLVLNLALGLYVAAYETKLLRNHLRGITLLATMFVMIVLVRVGLVLNWSPYLVVVPVMVTAIILTIAYSQRFALGVASYLALICVLALSDREVQTQPALGVLLATGAGMGIAILTLRDIRTRSKLLIVGTLAGVVVFAVIWLVSYWQKQRPPMPEILTNSLYGGLGAFSVGIVIQALLPIIERIFNVATGLTLLDYSEAKKPLLRRLAMEAPGTFNHSWQLGMMAESAAEAIGANGLLCRVGCYYHDVGKLGKPRYFVENQAELFNQHKELSPTMSRIIIFGHVKDGLELAREYKLPQVLHQFIATHHGTTLVKYFYAEALKKAQETGSPVNEMEFRYPGPKPQTREAAIIMITDAVEGATRAMQEPTPSRIESVVHQLVMERLQDGQFDECDLTMKELKVIEDSLVKSLCGMYHTRIAYPKIGRPGEREDGAERERAGQEQRL